MLKELNGLYDVVDATDLEVVANVFGPALERRARNSRKRSRSSGMSDLARQLEQLAQSKGQETTLKAKKTAVSSRSTRAKPIPLAAEESQADQEEEDEAKETAHR